MKISLFLFISGIAALFFDIFRPLELLGSYSSSINDSIINYYSNPVFIPILADPSVIYDESVKKFYAYGTADSWADGEGVRLVPIIESTNLVDWKYIGDAFDKTTIPKWKKGGFWAPDVVQINGKYHLYYSISVWADSDPCIGVAVADSPKGPFVDKGRILCSSDIDVPNSIDPFYYEEGGTKYLFWGSFSSAENQGIYGVELSEDGLKIPHKEDKFKIAAGDWEAVVIHKRNNYYYMIGSKGSCCEGASSTYHVLVGRSKFIKGPYLDEKGNDIAARNNGTIILKGNKNIVGPGHTSRIITDSKGKDWILYHGMQPDFAKLSNGVNRRTLLVDEVRWNNNDWPIINTGEASTTNVIKLNFN